MTNTKARLEKSADVFGHPPGVVSITLDIEGLAPATFAFESRRLPEQLADINVGSARQMTRPQFVDLLEHLFVRATEDGDQQRLRLAALGALWSAYSNPFFGRRLRQDVSKMLQMEGRAHVTWGLRRDGVTVGIDAGGPVKVPDAPATAGLVN